MKGSCNSPPVRMFIVPVAAGLTGQPEPVALKCRNQTAGGERAKSAVIDFGHTVTETSTSSRTMMPSGMGSPSASISSITT